MRRLNGWQRLGVVLSAGWLLVITSLVVMPSASPALSEWLYPCKQSIDPLCLFNELSVVRFAILTIAPLLFLWAFGYGISWVRKGFSGS